ncbi:MAG TPA: hypothetical protein VHO25_13295 [Polyangiaceae bacterium]|nr:hypothetical protein [Polyangiaceae bacterium]
MLRSGVGLVCALALVGLIACEEDEEPSYVVGPGGPGPNTGANGGAGGSAPMGPPYSMYYPVPDGGYPACGVDRQSVTLTIDGVTYDLEIAEVRYDVCRDSRSLTLVGCDAVQGVCFSLLVTGGATSQIHRVHQEDGSAEWVEESTVLTTLALPDPVACATATGFTILLSSAAGGEPGEPDAAVAVDSVDGSADDGGASDASAGDAGARDASTAEEAPTLMLNLFVSENRCLI